MYFRWAFDPVPAGTDRFLLLPVFSLFLDGLEEKIETGRRARFWLHDLTSGGMSPGESGPSMAACPTGLKREGKPKGAREPEVAKGNTHMLSRR